MRSTSHNSFSGKFLKKGSVLRTERRSESARSRSSPARGSPAIAFCASAKEVTTSEAPDFSVYENNLYATEVPLDSVSRNPDIASRAAAYGIPGVAVDGNNVLAVLAAVIWLIAFSLLFYARAMAQRGVLR
jgi:hypothetical protein